MTESNGERVMADYGDGLNKGFKIGSKENEKRIKELEAENAQLKRERNFLRQFVFRQANNIPDPNSAASVLAALKPAQEKNDEG